MKALLEEQERMVVEEHLEKVKVQEEEEERLANVAFVDTNEVKDVDCCRDDVIENDITDQEKEERPFVLIAEDDTKVNYL